MDQREKNLPLYPYISLVVLLIIQYLLISNTLHRVWHLRFIVCVGVCIFISVFGGKRLQKGGWVFIYTLVCLILLFKASYEQTFDSGLRTPHIISLQGIATSDTSLSASHNSVFSCNVTSVSNTQGDTTSAKGEVVIISQKEVSVYQGFFVTVRGSFLLDAQAPIVIADHVESSLPINKLHKWYVSHRIILLKSIISQLNTLPYPASYMAKALFIGVMDEYSLLKEYSLESGAAHVLALSGLHMNIVMMGFAFLISKTPAKKASFIISFCVAVVYVAIVGVRASLLRALLLVLFAHVGTKRFSLLKAYVVQLLLFPSTMLSVASLLSYGSILSLVLFSSSISRRITPLLPLPIAQGLGSAIGVNMGTTAFSLALFGVWYPIGIPLSLVIIPLATMLLSMTMMYVLAPVVVLEKALVALASSYQKIVEWGSFYSIEGDLFFYLLFVIGVLTVLKGVEYASCALQNELRRSYNVGLSLRFTHSNTNTLRRRTTSIK